MAQRGRPAYKPTKEERKLLRELRDTLGEIKSLEAERDDLIKILLDSPVPAQQIANVLGVATATISRRRRPDDPQKVAARNAVTIALRNGELTYGPCEVCGEYPTQAHHHNGYNNGHELDVIWLCREHHHHTKA